MAEFVSVAKVGSIPEGQGESFVVGERIVAIFHIDGQFFAIDDICPHMGASLAPGYVDDQKTVACPWHAWRFSIVDGTWCDNPKIKVDSFEVKIEGDDIQVRIPDESE